MKKFKTVLALLLVSTSLFGYFNKNGSNSAKNIFIQVFGKENQEYVKRFWEDGKNKLSNFFSKNSPLKNLDNKEIKKLYEAALKGTSELKDAIKSSPLGKPLTDEDFELMKRELLGITDKIKETIDKK